MPLPVVAVFVSCAAVCIGVRAECWLRYLPVIAECSFAARGFERHAPWRQGSSLRPVT